ncbi:hypothetical protein FM036_41150, partial [Nostoc sp. HG1]|nr:hypothetical protein [Nostoc sp. HG1]
MKSSKQPLITDPAFRYLILFGFLGSLFIHSFIKYGLLNQIVGLVMPKAVAVSSEIETVAQPLKLAQVPVINSDNGFLPDWSRMRFIDMIVQDSDSVTYQGNHGNETRTWNAGQSIAEFLELGDFEESELSLEKLQLSSIAKTLGIKLESLKLSDFDLLNWQTLPDLVKAIPGLGEKNIPDVIPIRDFLQQVGIASESGRIQDISSSWSLSEIPLGKYIDLSRYSLTAWGETKY